MPIKKPTTQGVQLRTDQAKKVNAIFQKIYDEQVKLFSYLEEIGIHPIDDWPDIGKWRLVNGLDFRGHLETECTECSVVCIDDPCDCTIECNNPKKLLPDPDSILTAGSKIKTVRIRKSKRGVSVFVEKIK